MTPVQLGLGPLGLSYDGIEAADIHLGGFADRFSVDGSSPGSVTNLFLGGGGDEILVNAIGGEFSISGDVSENFRLHFLCRMLCIKHRRGCLFVTVPLIQAFGVPVVSNHPRLIELQREIDERFRTAWQKTKETV